LAINKKSSALFSALDTFIYGVLLILGVMAVAYLVSITGLATVVI
jgi:hypothetical protein